MTVNNMREHIIPSLQREQASLAACYQPEFADTIRAIDDAILAFGARLIEVQS